jgi:tRNA 2-selenouridine synthase
LAVTKLDIESFYTIGNTCPVLDVRSPGEYAHAHIPGAYNLPLFSDEERAVVGTHYKQKSREIAIKTGLDFFGPKMRQMVEAAESILKNHVPINTEKKLLVHCWRGGMRSAAVAWLLDLYGFEVYTLNGGYKKYRQLVLQQFEKEYPFRVLGGYTGSGKTYVLEALQKKGEPVIHLEDIAKHKGSAFGAIGMPIQPSQEMFENLLAEALLNNEHKNHIWVEDESQRIGLVNIPVNLWHFMRRCPVYFLDIPFEERLKHITEEYGVLNREKVGAAIVRIGKRLGPLETKTALQFLAEENITDCFSILLKYYDKWYLRGLNNRDGLQELLINIPAATVNALQNALLLEKANQLS